MTIRERYHGWVHRAARRLFPLWERLGLHVTPVHFYQPVPDTRRLPADLWSRRSELVGIDMNEDRQLALLRDIASRFRSEYDRFPRQSTDDPRQFHLGNGVFDAVDAEVLYAMIRLSRPRRLIEIGSGWSTILAAQAIRANRDDEPAYQCELTTIDPYPSDRLPSGVDGVTRVVPSRVEDVRIEEFCRLERDDILFIDSSHVLRTGGDVWFEFLEVLPRLAPGVLVHIHDVFLPEEYPRQWLTRERWFFTEQYLLQAFLAFNVSFEVVWAGNYLRLSHPEELRAAFASFSDGVVPGSFWLRRAT